MSAENTSRWNIDREGEDLLICFGDHERHEGCEYVRYVRADATLPAHSTGSAGVAAEPVAEVLWYDPEAHFGEKKPHKIIDGSLAFMDRAPLGTKLYEHPPAAPEERCDHFEGALLATKEAADDLARACVDEGDDKGAGALQFISGLISDFLAAAPTPPAGGGETEAKPYGPVRGRMAEGCCSAVSPCSHQQRDPTTLCEICQKAARLTDKILAADPSSADGSEAAELVASERISAAQVAYDRAMEDYDPTAPDHEVQAFDAMKEVIAVADALAPVAPWKGPTEEEIAGIVQVWTASSDYAARCTARAILALLTPADRGETQAAGDGRQIVPVEPTPKMLEAYWQQTGESREMRPRTEAYAKRYYAAMLAVAPSSDQNRGEPNQGGANTEDRA